MLNSISPDALKKTFNADRDKLRIVALLSPSCALCQSGQMVVRDIFGSHASQNMKGYIVWLPMLAADTRAAATERAGLVPDSRIEQRWGEGLAIGALFQKTLQLTRTAWDIYLVYPPGTMWEDDLPPKPGFWMHQLRPDSGAPPALFLDAERFSAAVGDALAGLGEKPVHLESVITCPHCGHNAPEIMPVDACVVFYDCKKCHARLPPKKGDCCVFCSYGSVKCPPIQQEQSCCGEG